MTLTALALLWIWAAPRNRSPEKTPGLPQDTEPVSATVSPTPPFPPTAELPPATTSAEKTSSPDAIRPSGPTDEANAAPLPTGTDGQLSSQTTRGVPDRVTPNPRAAAIFAAAVVTAAGISIGCAWIASLPNEQNLYCIPSSAPDKRVHLKIITNVTTPREAGSRIDLEYEGHRHTFRVSAETATSFEAADGAGLGSGPYRDPGALSSLRVDRITGQAVWKYVNFEPDASEHSRREPSKALDEILQCPLDRVYCESLKNKTYTKGEWVMKCASRLF